MASNSLRSKTLYHVRSASFPSISHPLTHQVDENLSRLRSSQSTSSSLSSIGNKLNILEEVFDSLDAFLQLPNNQQALARNEKWVEEILNGYMRLLDLCAEVKDIYFYANQNVQDLLSMLRKRKNANEIEKYLISRKKTKSGIRKSLKDLKNIKIKHINSENKEICSLFVMVEEATAEVFESLMTYIAGSKSQSKLSGLVAKKYFGNSLSFKKEVSNTDEFEKVDDELNLLVNSKAVKVKNTMKFEVLSGQLTEMESKMQDVEQGLESLFRRLIKTRVALLNTLNH